MLIALARTQSVSSWPYSNKVVDVEVYRRINVSMCPMCIWHWPEGKLGVECFVTCQVYDIIQTHTWHIRYRFCLINFVSFTTSFKCQYCDSLEKAICSCILQNQNWCQKYTRLFNLQWTCLFCYLLLTSFLHDNPSLEGRTQAKIKIKKFRWKYDTIA